MKSPLTLHFFQLDVINLYPALTLNIFCKNVLEFLIFFRLHQIIMILLTLPSHESVKGKATLVSVYSRIRILIRISNPEPLIVIIASVLFNCCLITSQEIGHFSFLDANDGGSKNRPFHCGLQFNRVSDLKMDNLDIARE